MSALNFKLTAYFHVLLQLFHVCQEGGRLDTYFCPNLTLFSQGPNSIGMFGFSFAIRMTQTQSMLYNSFLNEFSSQNVCQLNWAPVPGAPDVRLVVQRGLRALGGALPRAGQLVRRPPRRDSSGLRRHRGRSLGGARIRWRSWWRWTKQSCLTTCSRRKG